MKLYVYTEGGEGQIGRIRVANEHGEHLKGLRGGNIQTRYGREASTVHLDLVVNGTSVILGEPPDVPGPSALQVLLDKCDALALAHDSGDTDLADAYEDLMAEAVRARAVLSGG